MINGGWVKLHRDLLNWEWYKDTNTKIVFLHLLLIANVGTSKYRGFTISEGQTVTSISEISRATGLSQRQIRTALNHLKSTGELTIKATNKFSVITIANWRIYQSNADVATSKMTSNESVKRQSSDKQPTRLIKEDKNTRTKDICPNAFDSFWSVYPKKQGKSDALKAWDKLDPDPDLVNAIINAVSKYKATESWQRDSGQYIPLPATFLRGRRWEDEISIPNQSSSVDPYADVKF